MTWFKRDKKRAPRLYFGAPSEAVMSTIASAGSLTAFPMLNEGGPWDEWFRHASPHDLSPLWETEGGLVRRHCGCGWRGPAVATDDETRAAHLEHRRASG